MNIGRKLERMTGAVERAFDVAQYGAESAHAACFGSGMAASSLNDCVRVAFCDDGPKSGGFAGKAPALVTCNRRRRQRRASIYRSVYPAQRCSKWNGSGARRGDGGAGCAEGRAAAVLGALVYSGQTAGACLALIGSRRREWPPAVHKHSAVVGLFEAMSEGVLRISIQTGALLSSVMWPVQRCTGFVTPMVATTDSYLQCIESKRYFNTGIWHASCSYQTDLCSGRARVARARTQSEEQVSRLRSRGSTPRDRWIWGARSV